MEIKQIKSWSQFVEEIEHLRNFREESVSKTNLKVSEFLYRGQSDSGWKLETTLERLDLGKINLNRYYNFISVIKAPIESVTDRRWQIPSREEYADWCKQQNWPPFSSFPAYEYIAYLRHHGFPSPLLDWSKSPYVAAFFAMIDAPKDKVEKVSVYAYLEYAKGIKESGSEGGPFIHGLGHYVTTHKRHYLQQCAYTLCTNRDGSSLFYNNHESVFSRNPKQQDLLWRMNIPVSQRCNFLENLEMMNINSFSLFETEDKLMEHLYISEVLLKNHL